MTMISLDSTPGTYPQDLVHSVLAEVFDRVQDTLDEGAQPPDIDTTITALRRHQRQDLPSHVDVDLQNLAHGCIAQLVRQRLVNDPRATGR